MSCFDDGLLASYGRPVSRARTTPAGTPENVHNAPLRPPIPLSRFEKVVYLLTATGYMAIVISYWDDVADPRDTR